MAKKRAQGNQRRRVPFILIAVLLGGMALVAAVFLCARKSPPVYQTKNNQAPLASYAGSASCQKCHEEEFADWAKSHHSLAERNIETNDLRAFQHPVFSGGLSNIQAFVTNGQPHVITENLQSKLEDFKIERVLGESPVRQFLVSFPGGRFQTLEASYDPRSNVWFDVYANENRRPGEWGHWTGRGMNWNSQCAACHNTRLQKNYHETNDTYSTTMAEMTVGCESCHGPLKAHNEWQQKFGASGKPDPTVAKLTRQQTLENCAFCHARRSDLTGDFKPGDLFSDNMKVSMVDRSDTFYADGQVRDEDYEYSAFLGSRMHAKGVICTDCHNPHTAKTMLPGNWLCLRCHAIGSTIAPQINPVLHSRHQVFGFDRNGTATNLNLISYNSAQIKETGGECINCHMPQTIYMQRHIRHDHGFTIPDPLLTKEAGIPNACNRCHQDKDADWALKFCQEWYGDKMNRPTRQRAQNIVAAKRVDNDAYKGLLTILSSEEIPYWRAVAAGLLDPWITNGVVRAALVRGLSDTNDLVRVECVHTLEPLADDSNPAVLTALQARLADPVRNVRIAAAWALHARVDHSSIAWQDLENSLVINADQPTGQMQKGSLALSTNDFPEALAHYRKAAEWDSASGATRHDYAIALSQAGQNGPAVEQMEIACRLEPKEANFQYELALAYHAAGQETKVIPTLQNAVQLDPKLSSAWYNLGLALNSAGQVVEALDALARAESLTSEPRIPYARATILAQLGRITEAKAAANRALDLQPDFKPARELLNSLQTAH